MAKNGELKNKLAEKASGNANTPRRPEETIREYLLRMSPEIKRALPKHMDADRLARIAMTVIRTTPKLLECNVPSLLAAVMQSAQLGLEPNILGHCFIIPYGKEAQFQIGYRGMIELARRSGNIKSITAHEVYENDYFKLKFGLDEVLEHIPWHSREDKLYDEPGDIRGFYMVAKFKDGGHQVHYMPKAEVDEHRNRSKAGNNGPWVTDYVEMGKKTVVRSAWKWMPISVEIMKQVESSDETVKTEIEEDMTEVPNIIDVEQVTEEVDQEAAESEAPPEEEAS